MNFSRLGKAPARIEFTDADTIALTLRIGLGSVFLAGGRWKLSHAPDPERADAPVSRYMPDNGYINVFLAASGVPFLWRR